VKIRHPIESREHDDVLMLIDTGADVTLLPGPVATALGLERLPNRYDLLGFDGQDASAEAVMAVMVLQGRTYRGQFLLIDQEWGILGRNILNTFRFTLDGPGRTWG